MPDREKAQVMIDREMETMQIVLWGRTMRSAVTIEEYVQVAVSQGMSKKAIRDYLLKDLEEGGRIFGEFRNAIKATGNGSLNRFRDVAQYSDMDIGEKKYRWVAVLVNTCPDCEDRHAKVRSWDEWEALGLPRSGNTVCKQHCRCVLLPEESVEVDVIKRGKRKK